MSYKNSCMHTAKRWCKTTWNRQCKDIQLWPFNFQALVGSATSFLLTLLGSVLCWHLGASSSPSPPCTQCPGKDFQKWLASLRCIMSGVLAAQFSQLAFQKVLNIHVLLHGHLILVTQNLQIFSQYPFKLLLTPGAPQYQNWKQKPRHPARDHCRRQNATAAAPLLHRSASAFGNPKLFTHQSSLKPVHSHEELQVTHTKGLGEYEFTERKV